MFYARCSGPSRPRPGPRATGGPGNRHGGIAIPLDPLIVTLRGTQSSQVRLRLAQILPLALLEMGRPGFARCASKGLLSPSLRFVRRRTRMPCMGHLQQSADGKRQAMATAVAVCSTLHGVPVCDPDRAGQADRHTSTRLLIVSGGTTREVVAKMQGPQGCHPWVAVLRAASGPEPGLGRRSRTTVSKKGEKTLHGMSGYPIFRRVLPVAAYRVSRVAASSYV
ncbi:MAG: hypothetical protein RL318_2111 [Fibrobacterota bacterium]|jgi:hypothetical protein